MLFYMILIININNLKKIFAELPKCHAGQVVSHSCPVQVCIILGFRFIFLGGSGLFMELRPVAGKMKGCIYFNFQHLLNIIRVLFQPLYTEACWGFSYWFLKVSFLLNSSVRSDTESDILGCSVDRLETPGVRLTNLCRWHTVSGWLGQVVTWEFESKVYTTTPVWVL